MLVTFVTIPCYGRIAFLSYLLLLSTLLGCASSWPPKRRPRHKIFGEDDVDDIENGTDESGDEVNLRYASKHEAEWELHRNELIQRQWNIGAARAVAGTLLMMQLLLDLW